MGWPPFTTPSLPPHLLWGIDQTVQWQDGVEAQQWHVNRGAALFGVRPALFGMGPAVLGAPYGRGWRGQVRVCVEIPAFSGRAGNVIGQAVPVAVEQEGAAVVAAVHDRHGGQEGQDEDAEQEEHHVHALGDLCRWSGPASYKEPRDHQ